MHFQTVRLSPVGIGSFIKNEVSYFMASSIKFLCVESLTKTNPNLCDCMKVSPFSFDLEKSIVKYLSIAVQERISAVYFSQYFSVNMATFSHFSHFDCSFQLLRGLIVAPSFPLSFNNFNFLNSKAIGAGVLTELLLKLTLVSEIKSLKSCWLFVLIVCISEGGDECIFKVWLKEVLRTSKQPRKFPIPLLRKLKGNEYYHIQ